MSPTSSVRAATILAIALGAAPGRAVAQSDSSKAAATAKVAEAQRLYEDGDYAGALLKLRAAYNLYPSPKIHFNFGQAYRGLARDTEAIEAFETFLAEAKDAPEELRTDARKQLAELHARVASVEVTCDEAGADVRVDGRSYGRTPLDRPILIAPGTHQIVVKKDGFPTFTETIAPRRAVSLRIEATLRGLPPSTGDGSAPPNAPPGAALGATAAPDERGRPPPASRWWIWAGIGVALVAGAALGYVLAPKDSLDVPETDLGNHHVSLH